MKRKSVGKLALEVHDRTDGAMDRLVRQYQDSLFNYALRLLGNRMDAQEVTQDTLLRAYFALATSYSRDRCATLILRPWLFRITRNLAYNTHRARRARREEPLEASSESHPSFFPSQLQNSGDLQVLEKALNCLPEEEREAVMLRFMEELSYREISKIVGRSEAAARGKVFRALEKLRSLMSEQEESHAV